MKKLLVLAFMVLFATGAFAQIAYFNAGTIDASTLVVSPDKWVEVPVWFTGEFPPVAIENMCFPLGIQVIHLDTLAAGNLFFPLTNWDNKGFFNYNDDLHPTKPNPPGYRSFSFIGFARPVNPDSPLLYGTGVPQKILSFMVHTDDTTAVGQTFTDLLISGIDPVQGVANTGDSLGVGGFDVDFTGCPIYFSPNQAPEIDPDGVFTMPYDCGYNDFSVFVDIFDNDGDVLDVTTNYGTVTLFATDGAPGEPTTYTYKIDFDMEDFCGDCASFFLEITADDGVNDPATVYTYADEVTIIGEIVASMDLALYLLPGESDWMKVYLDACGDCFCLGGFVFSIEYDPSILSILDVEAGAALAGGEYWNVVYNFDGPGTIRVVFINDLNNQTQVEPICAIDPEDALFKMEFLLSADYEYPSNFCNPICFMFDELGENHYDYNNVSDQGGYHIWINDGCDDAPDSTEYGTMLLTMECGNIKIVDCNVIAGDINLNGHNFEVGDAVLLANHLIDPAGYPFTLRQMVAADANLDGLRATVADLIYMINMLNGVGGGKVAPLDVVATIAMPADASGNVDIVVRSEVSVGGALVSINHTGVELGVPTIDGMNIDYRDNGEVMTVLVYKESESFAPGTNVLFTVPVLSEGAISFGEVSVSDDRGALLSGRVSYEADLPTEFAISQNYPNPFNAKTSFKLEVPATSDVTVNVYNVAGQLVKAMNMHLDAGVHSVVWDASDVASGVYFYRVVAGDQSKTLKMTLLK
jgi:hypothetical protein